MVARHLLVTICIPYYWYGLCINQLCIPARPHSLAISPLIISGVHPEQQPCLMQEHELYV